MKYFFLILFTMFFANIASAEQPVTQGSSLTSILMLIVFFAIAYFLLMRPQIKRNKAHKKMLSEIIKGDEVITTSGILGKIIKVGVNYTEVQISENTFIQIQKSAISVVLPKGSINRPN